MSVTKLEATAQLLDLDPGLYAVDILSHDSAGAVPLMFPCARLDPITSDRLGAGRAFVSTLAPTPFFASGAHPAYLRVEGGRATVLLTIYKPSGIGTKPELRIRLIDSGVIAPVEAADQPLASLPLAVLAHIERAGDLNAIGGQWAGAPTGNGALEGFSITPSGDIGPADIEYQAVLGSDWSTPWMQGGDFCGSRGMSLPILGVRVRMSGATAKAYSCTYWAAFIGQPPVGPVADGADCAADGAPMAALRIVIVRRAAAVAAAKQAPVKPMRRK